MSDPRDDDDPFADLVGFGSVPPPRGAGDVHSASTTVAELSDSFIDQLKGGRAQTVPPANAPADTRKVQAFDGTPGAPDIRLKGPRSIPRAVPAAGRPATPRGPHATPLLDADAGFSPESATAPRSVVLAEAGDEVEEVEAVEAEPSMPPRGAPALAAPPVPQLGPPVVSVQLGSPGAALPTPAAWGSPPSDPVAAPAAPSSSAVGGELAASAPGAPIALASLGGAAVGSHTRRLVLVAVGVALVLAALLSAVVWSYAGTR